MAAGWRLFKISNTVRENNSGGKPRTALCLARRSTASASGLYSPNSAYMGLLWARRRPVSQMAVGLAPGASLGQQRRLVGFLAHGGQHPPAALGQVKGGYAAKARGAARDDNRVHANPYRR